MQNTENLKFILGRFDHYIDNVHTKSNLYIVLNTFIIGGFITMLTTINLTKLNTPLIYMILLIILLSVISLIIILSALKPHLSKTASKSIIFFNDVSGQSYNEFHLNVTQMDGSDFIKDLTTQIHCISKVLSFKYHKLKLVSYFFFLQFLIIMVWTFIFIFKNN